MRLEGEHHRPHSSATSAGGVEAWGRAARGLFDRPRMAARSVVSRHTEGDQHAMQRERGKQTRRPRKTREGGIASRWSPWYVVAVPYLWLPGTFSCMCTSDSYHLQISRDLTRAARSPALPSNAGTDVVRALDARGSSESAMSGSRCRDDLRGLTSITYATSRGALPTMPVPVSQIDTAFSSRRA